MRYSLLLLFLVFVATPSRARHINVKTAAELQAADASAVPGDTVFLADGSWFDARIKLTATGTGLKPIVYKAEHAGKVFISGHSSVSIAGHFLVIDGLNFIHGFGGADDVISFRKNKDSVATDCRVTNCAITGFNNGRRMDENFWVAFYGKGNRVDHCSFTGKLNMGVLLMVSLDEENSRESHHSIDHNYFGVRLPLASNSGEIIRIGVAQTSQYESFTDVHDNLFEDCDGETEIISVKCAGNKISRNVFLHCQGGVVLRHGNNNTVENNLFLGDGKAGTGGVRIINKGQWIINNYFYECRGIDFRSPLSIMNGVPNSPLFRYVQVEDAVVAGNTFYNCTPISLCEGSDTERTATPKNVFFLNNIFCLGDDTVFYQAFDTLSGFRFYNNETGHVGGGKLSLRSTLSGFSERSFGKVNDGGRTWVFSKTKAVSVRDSSAVPVAGSSAVRVAGSSAVPVAGSLAVSVADSLQSSALIRLGHRLAMTPGFTDVPQAFQVRDAAFRHTGTGWSSRPAVEQSSLQRRDTVDCPDALTLLSALRTTNPVLINLTGNDYRLEQSILIHSDVKVTTKNRKRIAFHAGSMMSVFTIAGSGNLTITDVNFDGSDIHAKSFISSDTSGGSSHYSLVFRNNYIEGLRKSDGCIQFFNASQAMVADSLVFRGNVFRNNDCNGFMIADETGNKGYYNAEHLNITHNKFENLSGVLLDLLRGGTDESTMGPQLVFSHNVLANCGGPGADTLIRLTGVQQSIISSNKFSGSAVQGVLLAYHDLVRAHHLFANNEIHQSGEVKKNIFVTDQSNSIHR